MKTETIPEKLDIDMHKVKRIYDCAGRGENVDCNDVLYVIRALCNCIQKMSAEQESSSTPETPALLKAVYVYLTKRQDEWVLIPAIERVIEKAESLKQQKIDAAFAGMATDEAYQKEAAKFTTF